MLSELIGLLVWVQDLDTGEDCGVQGGTIIGFYVPQSESCHLPLSSGDSVPDCSSCHLLLWSLDPWSHPSCSLSIRVRILCFDHCDLRAVSQVLPLSTHDPTTWEEVESYNPAPAALLLLVLLCPWGSAPAPLASLCLQGAVPVHLVLLAPQGPPASSAAGDLLPLAVTLLQWWHKCVEWRPVLLLEGKQDSFS